MWNLVILANLGVVSFGILFHSKLVALLSSQSSINGVLNRSMLHLPEYWWCMRCTSSFYVTSPRILVVYLMYYIDLSYIPQDTGCM